MDHAHLIFLHNEKKDAECALFALERDRRVYLEGIDHAARLSILRSMETFDLRADASVLLEEVDLDEEEEKERERDREREADWAVGGGGVAGGQHEAGGGFSTPRAVFPYTPRPLSLSRRLSTSNFSSYLHESTAVSPPLFATTLTCSGCDALVPVVSYAQHLLSCSTAASEAGQCNWMAAALEYLSAQWEFARPWGGGDERLKVRASAELRRRDRAAGGAGGDRLSGKERERQRELEYERDREADRAKAIPVGTSTLRIQGLVPQPPLLRPSPASSPSFASYALACRPRLGTAARPRPPPRPRLGLITRASAIGSVSTSARTSGGGRSGDALCVTTGTLWP